MLDFLQSYFDQAGWQVIYKETRPGRERELVGTDDLTLSPATRSYLARELPGGIYRHQHDAIALFMQGEDLAISTGAASGKSAVFYAAGVQLLSRDPRCRILAVYPTKALAREQEVRWAEALDAGGLANARVARVDGDVPRATRIALLRGSSVVIATPDVMHAWMLPNVGEKAIYDFVSHLGLLVVDEVHVYTGVFGSNSAFLFRRLEHVMSLSGRKAAVIAASATIRDPRSHLRAMFGREFAVIDEIQDTSRRCQMDLLMVQPPRSRDLLTSLPEFLRQTVRDTDARFIVFVDSRKQTELITSILARSPR